MTYAAKGDVLVILTQLTTWETRINILLWMFLLATLMTTLGLSGIVNFRLRERKHAAPPIYRGRRRADEGTADKARVVLFWLGLPGGRA